MKHEITYLPQSLLRGPVKDNGFQVLGITLFSLDFRMLSVTFGEDGLLRLNYVGTKLIRGFFSVNAT